MRTVTNWASLYSEHVSHLANKYGAVLEKHGVSCLAVYAGDLHLKHPVDDQDWPLACEPTFSHWLPLREPGACLLIRPGATPELLRPAHTSFWEGPPPPPPDHVWNCFEVKDVRPDELADLVPSGATVLGADTTRFKHAKASEELIADIHYIRSRKTSYEVECLLEASRRAVRGHRAVFSAFHAGAHSELDLHLRYLGATEQDDSETPYKCIVALDTHAAILHHIQYGRTPSKPSAALLLDAGATHLGYASDITRTEIKGEGAAVDTFRALIAGVDEVKNQAISNVRVEMPYEDLHDRAHELLADVLCSTKIATGSTEALVEEGVTRALFPHGLGHSLGIQVHDVGCKPHAPTGKNPFLRHTSLIEAGQVFTVEPGCYFIDALLAPLRDTPAQKLLDWDLVAQLRPFGGVRMEDNVLVKEDGVRNLTQEAFQSAGAQ